MSLRGTLQSFIAALVVPCLCACASAASVPTSVSIETVFASERCNVGKEERAAWLRDEAEFRALWARVTRWRLDPPPVPVIDWLDEIAVLVSMGTHPTSGYTLDLAGDTADIVDGTLVLPVFWVEPDPGSPRLQVITSPCLLLKMKRLSVTKLKIVDQNGRVRTEISTPSAASIQRSWTPGPRFGPGSVRPAANP